MNDLLSVSLAAREAHVNPQRLVNAFYRGRLSSERCPVIGGRRIIPRDYIPEIQRYFDSLKERREAVSCW